MIHFACKRIEIGEIVRCSFALSKSEYGVLEILAKSKNPLSVQEISKRLSLERTGTQKALKGLLEKGIALRKKCNLPGGGYSYCYFAASPSDLKKRMKESVKGWVSGVYREIDSW